MAHDIGDWLEDLGLGKYVDVFAENEIDLRALRHITEEDLKDIGIALGARRILLAAISELRAASEAAAVPAGELLGERRQVTVLFSDLSDFTGLSSTLGAEATHILLNRYFETVDRIVEDYGGTIDKHIGDSVMAVFGAPIAHSNDPERAVRTALDIHEAMKDLSRELGQYLQAHIGIASGQVVASGTGSDSHREYTVTGDTVNLASRLDELAGPGETLVSRAVQSAVTGIAFLQPRGEAKVKGLPTPISIWAVEGLDAEASALHIGPFVAREMEQLQFRAMLQGCQARGRGQGLVVLGAPGIGKTRLVALFAQIAAEEGFAVQQSLVLDFGVGKGQDTVGALCRGLLGIAPGSGKVTRAAAAEAALAEAAVVETKRVFINELLDLPQSPTDQSLYHAMEQEARDQGKRATMAELAANRAKEKPLAIIVEDIHWADESTLAYLRVLISIAGEAPLILVMSSRIEGPSLERDWLASLRGATLSTMELQPLGVAETKRLAKSLGQAAPEQIERCVARSEGNPLFLVQMIRSLKEEQGGDLPDSLHGLILARMDRLPSADKTALQAASVIGQRFSLEALCQVSGAVGYDCGTLLAHRLVRTEGHDYLFDHALIREGVYASLLQDRRKALHRRAADWYRERDLLLTAEHLDRAEDRGAPEAYLAAARQESAHHRIAKARDLVERGLELCSEVSSSGHDLHLLHGEILQGLEQFEASTLAFASAAPLAKTDEARCTALLGQAFSLIRLDRHRESEGYLDRAERLATQSDLPGALAQVHRRRATIAFVRGDNVDSLAQSRQALRLARRARASFVEAEALSCIADAESADGRFHSARRNFEACLEQCRRHGYRRFAVMIEKVLGDGAFYDGKLTKAREIYDFVLGESLELGNVRTEIVVRHMFVYLACLVGRAEEALSQAETANGLIRRGGVTRQLMDGKCYMAMAQRVKGDRSAAVKLLAEAEELAHKLDIVWNLPFIYGERALAAEDPAERLHYLKIGEDLLARGVGGFYNFEFHRPALEACIENRDWERLERLATVFADRYSAEPLGFPDFLVARARAIAAAAHGQENVAALRALIERATEIGAMVDIPALEKALSD